MKYWAFISYRHLDNDPQRDGQGNRWAGAGRPHQGEALQVQVPDSLVTPVL